LKRPIKLPCSGRWRPAQINPDRPFEAWCWNGSTRLFTHAELEFKNVDSARIMKSEANGYFSEVLPALITVNFWLRSNTDSDRTKELPAQAAPIRRPRRASIRPHRFHNR
jgi:hypothetical protein